MLNRPLNHRSLPCSPARRGSRGVALLESLIAILVYAIGLLGRVKIQAYGVTASRDALCRAEASVIAHELIGIMWTDRANLAAYQHQPGGSVCSPTGAGSTHPAAVAWRNEFTTPGNTRHLPGATAANQQVIVDLGASPPIVRVHLCWRAPNDTADRSFVAVSQLPA
jgi:type IV pilus assembly protein PilV